MSYASVANFRAHMEGTTSGTARLSAFLQEKDATAQNVVIQDLLDEATAVIDSAAAAGYYAVPINPSAAPSGLQAELTALLKRLCIEVAAQRLSPGIGVIPQGFEPVKTESEAFLAGIRGVRSFDRFSREVRAGFTENFPGLVRAIP